MTALRDEGRKEQWQENKSIVSPCPVAVSPGHRVLVLGLGNPILGDDGVGWRVAEQCAERVKTHPPLATAAFWIEVDSHSGGGLSLVERLVGYDRAILIDAISAGSEPPGSITCFPLEAMTNRGAVHTSSAHDTSLVTALELARCLGARVPETVIVVAVQAQNLYELSEELSPTVETAVPEAVERVLDQLAAWAQMPS